MADYRRLRILITRLSAIGDCILTVPLVCALRDRFPNAFIAWVVERSSASLLEGHQALDELIVLPRGWLKSPKGVWALRRRLRELQFDVAIDPQGLTKSATLGWLSGARRRIGFDGEDGRELSRWLNNELVVRRHPHVVDRTLDLLKPLEVESPPARFDMPVYQPAAGEMDGYLSEQNIKKQFALINVGAGWPSKLWPAERYGDVARHLGQQHALPSVIIWAGDAERTMAESAARRAGEHAVLAPPTTLTQLAELARRAKLFVGSDTGPLHIAAAVGTPCVTMYGPTRPEVCGPYGSQHIALQSYLQEAEGNRARRSADNDAMRAVSSEMVCEACDQIVNNVRLSSEPTAESADAA